MNDFSFELEPDKLKVIFSTYRDYAQAQSDNTFGNSGANLHINDVSIKVSR